MEEVSCRATQRLVDAVESLGIDPACLVEGLPVSLEQIRDPSLHVDWEVFAAVNDNLARKLGGLLARERLGPSALARDYERLMQVRDDFRRVLEAIPSGVVIHRDGVILWVNAAVAGILGYDSPDEIVGKAVFSLLHPDDSPRLREQLAQPIEAIREPSEYRVLRRDGQTALVDLRPVREVGFGGRPARLVVGEDVTEKRRMQEQLLIADRMAALGMVAAGVAHEINNPLSFAVTGLEVAARALDSGDVDTARVREAVATAREGLARVRAIVGDLRTFSRPESERVEIVELPVVLDSTLQLAERAIEPRARVLRDYGEAPPVHASRARLGQVFLNLLLNAAEALPESDPEHNVIRVRTGTDKQGRALVEIADTGVGVPDAESQRVFEPFFTTKRASKGTGLGLSVCHRIVTGYGGEIRVVSPPDDLPFNTVFSVALPVD